MRKNKQNSLLAAKKAIRNADLYLGLIDGRWPLWLSPRDRSLHTIYVGGTGCGKTTTFESCTRQDISAGRGCCVIDPMGALYYRLMKYCCYLRAIGYRVPEVIPWNPSDGQWVLPFNPFVRKDGDLSVQVDRRVAATLRAWGQQDGNETPRLEKWLKCLFTVIVSQGLTIMDAGYLMDQQSGAIRAFLLRGLGDRFIQSRLEQLIAYKPSEFSEQTESVQNRLMRFLCSDTLRRTMGVGPSALDFRSILDSGKVLLVNLKPSNWLSVEQARLIGSLAITEFYEAAITRESGAKPYYIYVDEAAQFVTPQLGLALEQCRQKGLHFNLAFQHLAQFKEESMRLYKAVKNNARNKLVFAVPDRQDAQELADDVFVGLAEPQIKYLHRRLSHRIVDVRDTSFSRSTGESESRGQSADTSDSLALSSGNSETESASHGRSRDRGAGRGRTFTRGSSFQTGKNDSHSHTEHESHSRGFSATTSKQQTLGFNSSESIHSGSDDGIFQTRREHSRSASSGNSGSESNSFSRTETGSDTSDSGDSYSSGTSKSSGGNKSVSWSRSSQESRGENSSWGNSHGRNDSQTTSSSRSLGHSSQTGRTRSESVTDQPGTRHIPFFEETPEHWTLEEQRWKASELIMRQSVGHCFVSSGPAVGQLILPKPRDFFIRPGQLEKLVNELYRRYCLPCDEAERMVERRQSQLLETAAGASECSAAGGPEEPIVARETRNGSEPIWNRSLVPIERKPGPKTDVENYAKVARIVSGYGPAWTADENLSEICDELDAEKVPPPKTWITRREGAARSWSRGRLLYPQLVIRAIKDRLDALDKSSRSIPVR